jgi:ubiquinone/menaquinone biosynthesis C-methylase UbiE
MLNKDNKYTQMQKEFYGKDKAKQMASVDHKHHNDNPDYWNILLADVYNDDQNYWKGKKALDFGCGTGRNVKNLLELAEWKRVDGVDISKDNIKHAKRLVSKNYKDNFKFYVNNGVDLDCLPENEYDFVMSTITLQHIAVYDIRFNLLKGMFRVMKSRGVLSIQMGYGDNGYGKSDYYANDYDAKGTNSKHDVIVSDVNEIRRDLAKIGFDSFSWKIRNSFSDGHPNWIFFKAIKP